MRSARVGIIAALLAPAVLTLLDSALALASPIDKTNADETVIVFSDNGAVTNIGSGVIVGQRNSSLEIVTAAHVVAGANPRIQLDSGVTLGVVDVDRIAGFDLAVLDTRPYDGRTESASFGQPSAGEDVHIWGQRLTQRYVESQASVTDLDPALP